MIIKETADKLTTQILFNPVLHQSVGCIIPQSLGVDTDGRKIVQAGTPLFIPLSDRSIPAVLGDDSRAMNAILLHDVDVTHGNGNGTACIFGFINRSRVAPDVLLLIATAQSNEDATRLLTFLTEA